MEESNPQISGWQTVAAPPTDALAAADATAPQPALAAPIVLGAVEIATATPSSTVISPSASGTTSCNRNSSPAQKVTDYLGALLLVDMSESEYWLSEFRTAPNTPAIPPAAPPAAPTKPAKKAKRTRTINNKLNAFGSNSKPASATAPAKSIDSLSSSSGTSSSTISVARPVDSASSSRVSIYPMWMDATLCLEASRLAALAAVPARQEPSTLPTRTSTERKKAARSNRANPIAAPKARAAARSAAPSAPAIPAVARDMRARKAKHNAATNTKSHAVDRDSKPSGAITPPASVGSPTLSMETSSSTIIVTQLANSTSSSPVSIDAKEIGTHLSAAASSSAGLIITPAHQEPSRLPARTGAKRKTAAHKNRSNPMAVPQARNAAPAAAPTTPAPQPGKRTLPSRKGRGNRRRVEATVATSIVDMQVDQPDIVAEPPAVARLPPPPFAPCFKLSDSMDF
ncbi:hypothetical protein HK105_202589 [Polyrhizophydium stewartii]|uniref:Uncharacterized protein n=1 Tax=Polyrhizophydium stewartii TaxID=2732419 RepID=A0ABR4NE35_9FUNG